MTVLSPRALLTLGLPAMPLAFVALPLYVIWPHYFANRFGVSLALIGALLMLARAMDALLDPWLGHCVDRWLARGNALLLQRCGFAATLLSVGFLALFFPHWLVGETVTLPVLLVGVWAALMASYLGHSVLQIALQTWGARLGGDTLTRRQIVGWREGLTLAGVVCAALIPEWLGMEVLVTGFVVLLGLSWWAWWHAPRPSFEARAPSDPTTWGFGLKHPWGHAGFRRLLGVFMLNGIASAIPATLMLFFIQDRLQLPAGYQSQFLGAYFLAAAVSLPLWLRAMGRFGLRRCWLAGMLISVAVFVWTLGLSSGDWLGYQVVCVLSGLALGADLIAPGALLNGLLNAQPKDAAHAGAFFGWWQVATKLNLALAAGLSLPLLQWLGYEAGARDAPALLALSWSYALLPCVLKLLAAAVLWASAKPLQTME